MIRKLLPAAVLVAFVCFPTSSTFAQTKPSPKSPQKKTTPQRSAIETLADEASEALSKKDFARAAELLEKFIAARPNEAFAHFQLGYAYSQLQRADDAKREFERGIQLEPGNASGYWNLGLLLLDSDPKAAIGPLSKATELKPDEYGYHSVLAVAYERSGLPNSALEEYRRTLELRPDDTDTRRRLGRLLLSQERPAEAEAEFREVLRTNPAEAPALLGLAQSLLAQKNLKEASVTLSEYLKQRPEDHENRLHYASLLVEQKEFEPALRELEKLPPELREKSEALALRVECLVAMKKFDEALGAQQKLVSLDAKNPAEHARLGRLLLQKRDFPAAEHELRVALQLDASQTEALRDLVATFYLAEKYPEALAAQDLLAKRETPGAGYWFIRATCYDKLKHKQEALEAYKKFLELNQGQSNDQEFQARQRIKTIENELKRR